MTCVWHDNVLYVSGEFDVSNLAELQQALDVGIASELDEIRVDMALCEHCGSACIGCLIRVLRAGKRLRFVATSRRVRRVLEIIGLDLRDDVTVE